MPESRTLCVNHQRYFHRYKTTQIETPIDLLAWLKSQSEQPKLFWQGRDGAQIAAIGSVLTLKEVPHFDADNDSDARFWGGHAFFPSKAPKDDVWDAFPRCGFFIPKYEIIQKGNTTTLIQHSINAPLIENLDITPSYFSNETVSLKGKTHLPGSENWHKLIKTSLGKIEEKIFDKVVMARRSTSESESMLDPFEMLSKMNIENSIRFALGFSDDCTFIGATPERLYKREGLDLYTEAVAGTRKRGKTEEEDAKLEKELMDSEKERHEFQLVKVSIEEGLRPLCSSLTSEKEDGVIKTPNVQHLHNPFVGKLHQGTGDDEILSALHPTAAMGGLPRLSALEHLEKNEPFERGWYASPIGYISEGNSEFAVGIRSALIHCNKMHLFAGTGIVEGSIAEKEWEELGHKTALWERL